MDNNRLDRIERKLEDTARIQATIAKQIAELRAAISEDHVDVMKLVVGMGDLTDLATTIFLTPGDMVSAG
ncbi:MAG: hypothetical protein OXO50_01495 [Caldilineaceae bacterium]|nr:hypothetical protein [Caldilineaceae bacterium]